MRIRQCWRTK